MEKRLLESWAIHERIDQYRLAAVPAEALAAVSASRGRGVAEQFALTLKRAGHPLDRKIAPGIREWGTR
jgi:hypothetical protein